MKLKSAFSSLASLALAAVVVFASSTCSAAILIKPKASSKYKKYVLVSWKAYKGAKGYTVYRAYEKKDIRYAEVVKTCSKNTRKIKDAKAKLCIGYWYWVVPKVKNSTKNLYSSSQAKKCALGWRYHKGNFSITSSTMRRGKKCYLRITLLGKPLSKYGVKWKMKKVSGVHQWHKKIGKKGQLGYFTSKKKGKGTFLINWGGPTKENGYWVKRTIVWK